MTSRLSRLRRATRAADKATAAVAARAARPAPEPEPVEHCGLPYINMNGDRAYCTDDAGHESECDD